MGVSLAASVHATTLQEAMVAAYQTNPGLQAQREKLRSIDETYVQAQAAFAPTVSLQVQGNYGRERLGLATRRQELLSSTSIPDYLEQNSVSGQLVISQPIYTSGRLSADVKAADASVRAGRAALRTAEANLLFNVIQVYMNVERDQEALDIRKLNLDMLKHQVDETVARQRAGEVTRTDVAQAQAQLASEQALYMAAQGQLEISRANYRAVVGDVADSLAPPPDLVGIPEDFDQTITYAERDNPDLQQALFTEQASKAKVYSARANMGPVVSAQLQSGYQGSLVPFDGRNLNRALSLTTTLVVPLYSGGLQASQMRQAADQNNADQFTIEDVHRNVLQSGAVAWSQMLVAKAAVEAQTRQIAAAQIAFEGTRKEYSNGDRSTLDVLIAEETLRDAELALVSARHDLFVARAAILQNMGWLEMRNLVSHPRLYKPETNLRAVEPKVTMPWQKPLEKLDDKSNKPIKPIEVQHSVAQNSPQ